MDLALSDTGRRRRMRGGGKKESNHGDPGKCVPVFQGMRRMEAKVCVSCVCMRYGHTAKERMNEREDKADR